MDKNALHTVNVTEAVAGARGERHLVRGDSMGMRLWIEDGPQEKPPARRDYETIGYLVDGRAEVEIEGRILRLEPGDSWVVPRGARHTYRIMQPLTALEVTSPPADDAAV